MAYTNPTLAQFKTRFFRDFPFGTDQNTCVVDQDIATAFVTTNVNINPDLFSSQEYYNENYFLLSAHYMVMNLRASSQGINGQFNFLQASKGVGAVSESFSIPQRILDVAYFSMLTKTNYGAAYLFNILPELTGQMFNVYGTTLS